MSKLYVVPTPIGNLEDITLRAVRILKAVPVIACEDTRRARQLLNHLGIDKKELIAYHNFNEKGVAGKIVARLQGGDEVALVSDAGMPALSDPGFELIRQVLRAEIPLEVLPGPSAIDVSAVLANQSATFTFLGFLKPKSGQRQNQLKKLGGGTYVIFVAPHQVHAVLEDIIAVCGETTPVFVGRELTKLHETHYRGTASAVLKALEAPVKGELSLVFSLTNTHPQ